eukprot:COSAG06_NODE_12546_length_1366_cov_0.924230_2_plen_242_part_00
MATYLVVMSIILLNMLIAVLSSSHAKVEASLEQEVAHVQTSVAIDSQIKSNNAWLPAPMNLLQVLAPNNRHRKAFWDFVIVLVGVPVMIIIAVAMWTPLGPYIAAKHLLGKRDADFGGRKKSIALNILGLWLCGTCPLMVSHGLQRSVWLFTCLQHQCSCAIICLSLLVSIVCIKSTYVLHGRRGRFVCGPTVFSSHSSRCCGKIRHRCVWIASIHFVEPPLPLSKSRFLVLGQKHSRRSI